MRTPLPSPKGGRDPSQFSAHFYCGQTAACIKMPLGIEVCVSPGDSVLDGDSAPPPSQKGRSPQFSAHVYCGQTAAWIKMSLATEVGLGPDHTVLDGDPALTSPTPPRQFSAHFYCGQMAECIKMPLGMEVTFKESRFLEKTFPGKTFPGKVILMSHDVVFGHISPSSRQHDCNNEEGGRKTIRTVLYYTTDSCAHHIQCTQGCI